MNNKYSSSPLFIQIIFLLITSLCSIFFNLPSLIKSPTDISDILKNGAISGQYAEWMPQTCHPKHLTASKGIFGTGLLKTYYFAVSASDGENTDVFLVRTVRDFGDNFDTENFTNTNGTKVKGFFKPMGKKLRETLAVPEKGFKKNGYSFGSGHYLDTLVIYRVISNLLTAGMLLLLAALSMIALCIKKMNGNENSAMEEKMIRINKIAASVILTAAIAVNLII